jgi:hypothetical protein
VPTTTFKTLVVASVLPRLDYGNGVLVVLVDLPAYLVRRLQSVQNAAARLICNLRRFDHITDALANLHWLRVPERVVFKVAVLTFKVLRGIGRSTSVLCFVSPISLVDKLSALLTPTVSWCHLSNCQRSAVGLSQWLVLKYGAICRMTKLPAFRRKLKTHLYSRSFPISTFNLIFIAFLFAYCSFVIGPIVDCAVTFVT